VKVKLRKYNGNGNDINCNVILAEFLFENLYSVHGR